MSKPRTGPGSQELRARKLGPGSPEASVKPGLRVKGPEGGSDLRLGPNASPHMAGRTWCGTPDHSCRDFYAIPREWYTGDQAWAAAGKGTRAKWWRFGSGLWGWGAQIQAGWGTEVKGEGEQPAGTASPFM